MEDWVSINSMNLLLGGLAWRDAVKSFFWMWQNAGTATNIKELTYSWQLLAFAPNQGVYT